MALQWYANQYRTLYKGARPVDTHKLTQSDSLARDRMYRKYQEAAQKTASKHNMVMALWETRKKNHKGFLEPYFIIQGVEEKEPQPLDGGQWARVDVRYPKPVVFVLRIKSRSGHQTDNNHAWPEGAWIYWRPEQIEDNHGPGGFAGYHWDKRLTHAEIFEHYESAMGAMHWMSKRYPGVNLELVPFQQQDPV